MSLFDAEPRSASVTTLEPCDCLLLTQQQLYEAIDETPAIAVNIIRLLSRRIRELNHDRNADSPLQATLVQGVPAAQPIDSPRPVLPGRRTKPRQQTTELNVYEGPWLY
jgi:CRP-like cAMP-binding protein